MSKVKLVACSGVGKVYGLLAREAALRASEKLGSDVAETLCLAYIVSGDEEIKGKIKGQPMIAIDGCPKTCAGKSSAMEGGDVRYQLYSIDMAKEFRGVDPGTATKLSAEGWNMVDILADRLIERVRKIEVED